MVGCVGRINCSLKGVHVDADVYSDHRSFCSYNGFLRLKLELFLKKVSMLFFTMLMGLFAVTMGFHS